ncbi:hypothetical protein MNQ98_06565 [Paenibacillus sp. N3/727]|uniref:DUF6612 family protein n=1 Tax=Paenibacillus sp. N3/727 TaxID=2925845 RepID=UPI001F52BDD1|nr:DUF6612 family protein [Paenibacillus sp. N3/727]UNK19688.1 hypothetical protein MNQ98_06565 [Paenibacillus sp. N3/727]
MKKWTVALLSVILVMGITACSKEKQTDGGATTPTTEQPTTGQTKEPPAEAPKEEAFPTVDELIQKSAEASQNMKSFSMDADIKQNIIFGEGESKQEQKVDMAMKVDTTMNPMEMYQEIQMNIPGKGKQYIKQYITQNGVYSSVDGEWFQLSEENVKDIMASMKMTTEGPEKQLEQFKSIVKDTKVSVEGDQYILTANVSGDSLKELAKYYMNQAGGTNTQTAEMMEQMDIKSIKIVYGVKKDTYLPTKSDMHMIMSMSQAEQSVSVDMKMNSTFSKHNEIENIEIPKEALNSAKSPVNVK